jgi:hypothetical protein
VGSKSGARSRGHVLAALATARRIGLDGLLPRRAPRRRRDLVLALIVARLLDPAAKLATARMLDPATASHSLGETLDLGTVPVRAIYAALDWLGSEQAFIENGLARRHLREVGDRGMITDARIEETLRPAGLDWITALRAPAIKELAADDGPLPLSLFDTTDMAEITSPDFPGERLVVCENPLLAGERAREREELLTATEKDLTRIRTRVERAKNPLHGAAEIGRAVGAVIGERKMAKHFEIEITDKAFGFARKQDQIDAEARLDGIYVPRTNLTAEQSNAAATVRSYKSLAQVERAFRGMKTVDLDIRPVFHWTAPRVRAHVLLCMLAYYLEWHMRAALAPVLFDDEDKAAAEARRTSPVAKAVVSKAAEKKARARLTDPAHGEALPVHGFRTLLADLGTLTKNTVCFGGKSELTVLAKPTAVQRGALGLLGAELTAM